MLSPISAFALVSCKGYKDLEASAFQQMLAGDPSAQLVDVRTPEEFAEGHLPGAANIDWQADDFREKAAESGKGTDLRLPGLILAMFAHGIFLSGLNTWINRYAGLLPGTFTIPAQSFLFAGIMLSRLLVPFLPIRTERYVLSGGIGAGIVLALGLVTGNGLALRLSLLVSGLLAGALLPCMLSIGCSRHREDTLMVTTSMLLALYLGQGISAPVIGGLESAFGLVSGIFLCALCMALTSLTARFRSSTNQTGGRRGQ